ncbi:MAG: hypothetical protein LAP21_13075 [Acidobacteriia bacterium]|nr:hypothetical protein [Terriglobia bacterium]
MSKARFFPSYIYSGSRIALAGAILIMLGLAAGCGAAGHTAVIPPPPTPITTTVVVTPANPSVNLIGQQQFSAAINGVPSTAVTWSVSGTACPGPTCGTIDAHGLYQAPWCVPTPATVTVTATSTSDPTKYGSTVITNLVPQLPVGGRYAFLFQGTDSDGLMFAAGTFVADTNGHITEGIEDVSRLAGTNTEVTFTGTYNVPCYHRGTITLTLDTPTPPLPQTQTFAFGTEANGSTLRFIEMDTTGIRGAGLAKKTDSSAFGTAAFTGDFAFGFAGSAPGVYPPGPARIGEIGRFNSDGAGNISAGLLDMNEGGTTTADIAIGGTYAVDSTTGRGTAIWGLAPTAPNAGKTGTPQGTVTPANFFSFYVVSANESFWISSSGVLAGSTLHQSGGPFANSSLNAATVFHLTGKNVVNQNSDVAVGIATPNGAGVIAGGPLDENFDTTLSSYTSFTGTYAVDAGGNGRGTAHLELTPSISRDMTFYLIAPNTAFLLDGTGSVSGPSVGVGLMEPQTGGPFSLASLSGSFYVGTWNMATGYVPVECGVAIVDGAGTVGGMGDESDIFGSYSDVYIVGGNYTMAASGRGTVPTFGTSFITLYIVSPTKALLFEMDNTQHQPALIVMEQ